MAAAAAAVSGGRGLAVTVAVCDVPWVRGGDGGVSGGGGLAGGRDYN